MATSYLTHTVCEITANGLLPECSKLPLSKYLNNPVEQDHRNIKCPAEAMLGFKRCRTTTATMTGIEPMHCIRKGQFSLGARCSRPSCALSLECVAHGLQNRTAQRESLDRGACLPRALSHVKNKLIIFIHQKNI